MTSKIVNLPAGLCASPDPITLIREEHALLLELCDMLEAIADGLPLRFERELAITAISLLQGSATSHTQLEEEALFPLLKERLPVDDIVMRALSCLSQEHERDEDLAGELIEALQTAVDSGVVDNPDSLGYVLRGYFECQRRHIAWENEVVLPIADLVLTKDDVSRLQSWIMSSNRPRCTRRPILEIRNLRSKSCDECPTAVPTKRHRHDG